MYSGPVDHFRQGFNSLESEMQSRHPVSMVMSRDSAWNNKMDMVRRNYGSHMAMRLSTEKAMFDHPHRVRGLESSSIGLQTVLGNDESISFEDFLNGNSLIYYLCCLLMVQTVPQMRPEIPKLQVHSQMEVALGLL